MNACGECFSLVRLPFISCGSELLLLYPVYLVVGEKAFEDLMFLISVLGLGVIKVALGIYN